MKLDTEQKINPLKVKHKKNGNENAMISSTQQIFTKL